MNRWIYVPVLVAQVSAQQAVSVPSEAEKALRDRVQQFYQLQFDKKFRQAEAFVADDTKDWYFASKKPDLQGFMLQKVEMMDGGTRAKVTVKIKSTMMMMGVGRLPFEIPTDTTWKLENGTWVWYVDTKAPVPTPFGPVETGSASGTASLADIKSAVQSIDIEALQRQVSIDTTTVTLTADHPMAAANITNSMPGKVEVKLEKNTIPGITVVLDKAEIGAGGKARISILKSGSEKAEGTVHATVLPLGVGFDIQVHSK